MIATPSAATELSPAYRTYLLWLLMACLAFNYVDRVLPSILLPSIKKEMALTDSQLGFITGGAFALFYSSIGLVLGRMADRLNRRKVLAICIAVWSVMTAATGLSAGFIQMAVARFGVGTGEAGLTPCAYSLIADVYPLEKRLAALGIYSAGIPFGVLTAFLVGGWINQTSGWRAAFIGLGVPGLALAMLVFFTIHEPSRGDADGVKDSGAIPSFLTVVKTLISIPSFRHCVLGTSLTSLVYNAIQTWVPSFLARSYGMNSIGIGRWLAPGVGLGGLFGTIVGGWFVSRVSAHDKRRMAWVPACATGTGALIGALSFASHTWLLSVTLITLPLILCPLNIPCYAAILQGLATVRMRGAFAAMSLFISGLIGLGLGPGIVGTASDILRPAFGEESLRYALIVVVPFFGLWSSLHFYLGGRHLPADLARARSIEVAAAAGMDHPPH